MFIVLKSRFDLVVPSRPINVPPPACHRFGATMRWTGFEWYLCDACNKRDGVSVTTRRWASSDKEIQSQRLLAAFVTLFFAPIPLLVVPIFLGVGMDRGGIYWIIYFALLSVSLAIAYNLPVKRVVTITHPPRR
jgi:hypothetical protein